MRCSACIGAHLWRRLLHLPQSPHAPVARARKQAISDSISANIYGGAATSPISTVTCGGGWHIKGLSQHSWQASDVFVAVLIHFRRINGQHTLDDWWLDSWYATLLVVVLSGSEVIDKRRPSLIPLIRKTRDIGKSLGRRGVRHEFSARERGIDAWRHRRTRHEQLDESIRQRIVGKRLRNWIIGKRLTDRYGHGTGGSPGGAAIATAMRSARRVVPMDIQRQRNVRNASEAAQACRELFRIELRRSEGFQDLGTCNAVRAAVE